MTIKQAYQKTTSDLKIGFEKRIKVRFYLFNIAYEWEGIC